MPCFAGDLDQSGDVEWVGFVIVVTMRVGYG